MAALTDGNKVTSPILGGGEIETFKAKEANSSSLDKSEIEKLAEQQKVVSSISDFLGKNQSFDTNCESQHKVQKIHFQDSLKGKGSHPCSKTTVKCSEKCGSHENLASSMKTDQKSRN